MNLRRLRVELLVRSGRLREPKPKELPNPNLPAEFSAGPLRWTDDDGRAHVVYAMSAAAARRLSGRASKPTYRILVLCESCRYWQFAGKLKQHQKACKRAAHGSRCKN